MKTRSLFLSTMLRLAVVAVAIGCGGGGGGGYDGGNPPTAPPPTGGQVVVVELTEHAFTPRSLQVSAGDTVRWVMRGTDPTHTVTAKDGSFDSGAVFRANGDAYQRTFSSADNGKTFDYSCRAHADCCNMRGSIRVGSNAPPPGPGYE